MTSKVLNEFKMSIKSFRLVPSQGGCFELTLDGRLVYSKLKEGVFPDEDRMIAEIAKALGS